METNSKNNKEEVLEEIVGENTANSNTEKEEEEKDLSQEEKKEDSEDLNTKYLRLMADFQNFKRRSRENESKIYQRAGEALILELLPVLDNLERAVESEASHEEAKAHKEGLELIFTQLKDVLTANGLEEINALEEEFDPNMHNAVLMEDTDCVESGKISCVIQKGYTFKGKVIRPAMVKVAN